MPWARLDDMLPMHPKVRELSDAAFRLYICAICWSSMHLSDGHIPSRMLRFVSDVRRPRMCADQLVEAGLWETVNDGWRIHDYLQYQPSAEKVRHEREAKAQRQERWRTKRDASHDVSGDESQDTSSRARTHPQPIPSPNGSVEIQPSDRNGHDRNEGILIKAIQQAMTDRTKQHVTEEQALMIAGQIIGAEPVRNPPAYVAAAINRDPNPRRFLPSNHPSSVPPDVALRAAGIRPDVRPARGDTVTAIAAQARKAIQDATP